MQKRILSIAFIAFLFSIIFISCSKLDTTDIGSDLLPAVDNVNTFEEILTINATQGIFNPDTTKVGLSDDQVLGKINNDPLFGTTTANVYAQFKPTFYPFYYNIPKDSLIGFDSVVLCLSYKGSWGDTMLPIDLQVREIPYNVGNNGLWDSVAPKTINYAPATGTLIGSTQVDIPSLGGYKIYANHKDSVKNQIRIKLTTQFATRLFALDTLVAGNNSFRTDSLFRAYTNGVAIIASGGGNSLLYTNLTDSSSKIEIHYRKKNGATVDTTFTALKISTATAATPTSSSANNIIRNRSGFPVSSPGPDEIYLQTTPGTYANLNIPSLSTISNRIIHRAELIIEQIPDLISSPLLTPPNYLYLELKDTTPGGLEIWKPIYFDLNPNTGYNPDNSALFYPGTIDFLYFGGYVRTKTVAANEIKYYNFNITRYVQQIVTKHTTNYTLRLTAPYDLVYPQYKSVIAYNNRLANGRIRVGSGTNANYKMRLRLVYSKI
ncbi:DUF4270 family protein [Ferruginibacter sp.]